MNVLIFVNLPYYIFLKILIQIFFSITQVEKQEKSKKKTGRAKRRIQYNRRFVNVVQTYSRRRGPNANTNS